jgi:hypothetical protein
LEPLPASLAFHLLLAALDVSSRQATGQTITAPAIADHLGIPPGLAGELIHALGETGDPADTPAPITHVNGTPTGSRP